MTTLFSDGFESGNFSQWTTTGSPSVVGSPVHDGSYAARIPLNSRVYKVFTDQDIAYARVYVRWGSNPSSGNQARLFNLGAGDGTGTLVYVVIKNQSGTLTYGLRTKNDSANFIEKYFESGPTPTINLWHCIELKWQKNTLNGAKLIVDGFYVGCCEDETTYDNQADTLNLQLEETEITAYYDCAVVADVYIEPENANLDVNNNLTVGNKITIKTPESGYWIDAQTVMIGGDPIFHIDQGIMGVKDISCGGYLGANSPTKLQFGATYTDCDRFDIGKPVAVGGTPIPQTVLADYDNEYKKWWLSRPTSIASGSAMTIVGGTGAGTTNEDSEATGGGAIMLGQGFEREDDPPRINLVDSGDHILYITAGSSVDVGADAVLANMKLDTLIATQLDMKSTNSVFAVAAGDDWNGDGYNAYLIPQNPTNGGLGLGTVAYPFKWVDATTVFTNGINILSGNTITVGGSISVFDNDNSPEIKISSTKSVTLTLEADTDNTTETDQPKVFFSQDSGIVTASVGFLDGENDFSIMQHYGNSLKLGTNNTVRATLNSAGQLQLAVSGSSGGIKIGGDTNLYRGSASILQTDDFIKINHTGATVTFYDINLYRQTSPSVCLELDDDMIIDGSLQVGSGLSVTGNMGATGNISADGYVHGGGSSGNAFKIGDDCYLVDINQANIIGVRGAYNSNIGGFRLGNANWTQLKNDGAILYFQTYTTTGGILPSTGGYYTLGSSSYDWSYVYANYLRYDVNIAQYDALDDLALVKNHKSKNIIDKESGEEITVIDMKESFPFLLADDNHIAHEKLQGYMLGCVKALVMRVEALENQLKLNQTPA